MATDFDLRVQLMDGHGVVTSLAFRLEQVPGVDDAAAFAVALQSADNILDALKAITDASVSDVSISMPWLTQEESTIPDASVDVAVEAAILVYINATGTPPKYGTLRVPAPIAALFEADGETVDRSNAALQTFIDNLVAAGVTISDGEEINTDLGVNGMARGYYRTRARSSR
jgi:hypothetical protein